MPGRQTGDNKFGLTPYIVGQTLGDGCNYSSIQQAIDDAFAAGGGVVGIRESSTPYIENLTLRAGVDLYGFCVDGRLPSFIGAIVIQGNHTFPVAGGFAAQLSQYITFSAPAGDAFTITATGGGQAILAMKFCGVEAQTVAGQRVCVLNPDGTSAAQFSTDNTNINSDSHCFEMIGAGSGAAFLNLGNANSITGNVFELTSGSGSLTGQWTQMNGLSICNFNTVNGNCSFSHTDLNASIEAVLFNAAGGQAVFTHCNVGSGAASGNWIDGLGGQVNFANVALTGSAQGIGAAVLQQKINWQPYGETAAVAIGSNRGTASFNSSDFSVTDGFVSLSGSVSGPITQLNGDTGNATPVAGIVQILGGPGVTTNGAGNVMTISSVEWIDSAVGGLLNVDQGLFDVGPNTYTLPAAPLQGEQVRFYSINSPSVVQANAGQSIQLGNQTSSVGGAATGTATGDCLVLVYNAAATRWCGESFVGNWVLS